jgi:hypothetical protein
MPNGLLGKDVISVGEKSNPYSVPATVEFATFSVNMLNTGSTPANVKLAISNAAVPALGDYIEYNAVVDPNGGILERTCLMASTNEKVIAESDVGNIVIRVYGLEKPIA